MISHDQSLSVIIIMINHDYNDQSWSVMINHDHNDQSWSLIDRAFFCFLGGPNSETENPKLRANRRVLLEKDLEDFCKKVKELTEMGKGPRRSCHIKWDSMGSYPKTCHIKWVAILKVPQIQWLIIGWYRLIVMFRSQHNKFIETFPMLWIKLYLSL